MHTKSMYGEGMQDPAIALTTAYYKRKFAPRPKIGMASNA
jgi:hypothetical protein